jgi:hypothetical protein
MRRIAVGFLVVSVLRDFVISETLAPLASYRAIEKKT